jgi:hypothetical protein
MRQPIFLFFIIMILFSCSTGKKAYERGDYYAATLKAVNRLRSNPDSEKARKALNDSYPMALDYYQERIDNTLRSGGAFKYSETVGYYEVMNHMADEISRSPAALELFPQVNYYTKELARAKELAAEEQYSAGLAEEGLGTRVAWKEAYFYFLKADQFVPGYKDVASRMPLAKFNATFKVIVEQIPVPKIYQLSSDFFLNQVIEDLTKYRPNEFVAYYSPESAEKSGIKQPDQLLSLNFDDFVIGQVYDKETIEEVRRDSVVVGTVTLPDGSESKVYGTVKARFTTFRREISSRGLLDATIIDLPINRVAAQRKFPGQFIWSTEWSTFQGDERALTKEQLALCNKKPVPLPNHQGLFIEFTKPIFNQLTPFLREFYRRY